METPNGEGEEARKGPSACALEDRRTRGSVKTSERGYRLIGRKRKCGIWQIRSRASCQIPHFLFRPIRRYPRSLVLTEPRVRLSSRAQAEGPFRASSPSPFGVSILPTRNNGTTTSRALLGRDGCWRWDT